VLPVTPIYVWCFVPGKQSGAGAIMRAGYCRFEHADQIRLFLRRPRAASVLLVHDEGEAAMVAREKNKDAAAGGGDGAEVAEEHVQVVTYAAAVDVAKGFGMVCTRVPGSRPDRRRQLDTLILRPNTCWESARHNIGEYGSSAGFPGSVRGSRGAGHGRCPCRG
jgi:hypothetical protein